MTSLFVHLLMCLLFMQIEHMAYATTQTSGANTLLYTDLWIGLALGEQ